MGEIVINCIFILLFPFLNPHSFGEFKVPSAPRLTTALLLLPHDYHCRLFSLFPVVVVFTFHNWKTLFLPYKRDVSAETIYSNR